MLSLVLFNIVCALMTFGSSSLLLLPNFSHIFHFLKRLLLKSASGCLQIFSCLLFLQLTSSMYKGICQNNFPKLIALLSLVQPDVTISPVAYTHNLSKCQLDTKLSLPDHISSITKSCTSHLRNLINVSDLFWSKLRYCLQKYGYNIPPFIPNCINYMYIASQLFSIFLLINLLVFTLFSVQMLLLLLSSDSNISPLT